MLMVFSNSVQLGERLHWAVELGSLHAPFWFVYVRARRESVGSTQHHATLPLHAGTGTGDDSSTSSTQSHEESHRQHVRQQRLLRFMPSGFGVGSER